MGNILLQVRGNAPPSLAASIRLCYRRGVAPPPPKAPEKSAPTSPTPEIGDAEIENLRQSIDQLDQTLLATLHERLECARRIGELKATTGSPTFVAPREKQVLRRLLRGNRGSFPTENLIRIYREVFAASREAEDPIRVVFAGARGSLGHAAACGLFGRSTPQVLPRSTLAACLADLSRRECHYAVVPAVLAPEGVAELALLHVLRSRLYLVAEFHLPLDAVLALPPRRRKVKTILVPRAFSDLAAERLPCQLPEVGLEAVAEIADAARLTQERTGTAAMVPTFTADEFGLRIKQGILGTGEDRLVRYLVAAREPASATGADKTTVAFGLINQAGNLQEALRPFSRRRVNLDLITACPAGTSSRGDLFFLDFEGHFESERIQQTLEEMRQVCSFVEVMGSYPVFNLESRSTM
jgi:chorismate mutase/prephenate dehydratase